MSRSFLTLTVTDQVPGELLRGRQTMRSLASFIMRGRAQAAAFAFFATAAPFCFLLGGAGVALVMLRKGATDGLVVALWALLPAAAWAWSGQPLAVLSLLLLVPMALCLRLTASWPWTLAAMVLSGVAVGGYVASAFAPQVDEIVSLFYQLYGARLDALLAADSELTQSGLHAFILTSFIRSVVCLAVFSALLALFLARAWQAALYNPGGLRGEMHSLRIPPVAACLLLAAGILVNPGEGPLSAALQPVFLAPLLVSGTALVHMLSRKAGKLATTCLVLYYALLPVSYPGILVLSCLDSFVNFRARLWSRVSG
ncbi:MAG: hypothetical protein OXC07_00380 [Kistimonas sp.]|nr:hypothetical protein [Kistimonas sp.]